MRRAIVPTPTGARHQRPFKDPAAAPATRQQNTAQPAADTTDAPTAPLTWAQRLKRVFEIDISLCDAGLSEPRARPNAAHVPGTALRKSYRRLARSRNKQYPNGWKSLETHRFQGLCQQPEHRSARDDQRQNAPRRQ